MASWRRIALLMVFVVIVNFDIAGKVSCLPLYSGLAEDSTNEMLTDSPSGESRVTGETDVINLHGREYTWTPGGQLDASYRTDAVTSVAVTSVGVTSVGVTSVGVTSEAVTSAAVTLADKITTRGPTRTSVTQTTHSIWLSSIASAVVESSAAKATTKVMTHTTVPITTSATPKTIKPIPWREEPIPCVENPHSRCPFKVGPIRPEPPPDWVRPPPLGDNPSSHVGPRVEWHF